MTRDLAVDAGVVGVGSLAICLFADRPAVMSAVVAGLFATRLALGDGPVKAQAPVLAACTLLGGFNDWNTVVAQGVYVYTVPGFLPQYTTIPVWMLAFWGLILRLALTLGQHGAGPIRDAVHLPGGTVHHPWLKVGLQLALVALTRQAIFAWYLDPLWSWLPFAAAGLIYAVLFGLDRHDLGIVALSLTVGPAVEALYIQVGGLHQYALGVVGGVPLWIILWWPVAMLVWKDLGRRALAARAVRSDTPPVGQMTGWAA